MGMDDTTADGRMWAAASYAGVLVALPAALVPLAQRNDAFALHHAKQALGVQITFIVAYFTTFFLAFVFFLCTFGLSHLFFIPVLMLMLIWPIGSSLHGIILATNGDWSPPIGSFGLGDRFFSGVTLLEEVEPPAIAEDKDLT